jgi:peptide methionine sulfoxide reductase MsrA
MGGLNISVFVGVIVNLLFNASGQSDAMVELYFGCGCFWHVQHEFIKAEQNLLGRSAASLTSLTGYAGGSGTLVCYSPPSASIPNYERIGHTEVVGMKIPESSVGAFAEVFWSLFVGINRVDVMDIGPGYRAAIGLPGGKQSPLFEIIKSKRFNASRGDEFSLEVGLGGDRDTLGEALVWVYDSNVYPFHQAEVYHQFHDDFMPGGRYPQSYNDLQGVLVAACVIVGTGCPMDTTPASTCDPAAPGTAAAPAPAPSSTAPTSADRGSGGSVVAAVGAGRIQPRLRHPPQRPMCRIATLQEVVAAVGAGRSQPRQPRLRHPPQLQPHPRSLSLRPQLALTLRPFPGAPVARIQLPSQCSAS